MPTNTTFCSKWLQKPDNTGRVCSRWLKQGKTASSFQCIVCNSGDLSCANGGWADLKKHFNRPKHIQCMKDVFGSISLTASNNQSLLLSNNKDDNSTCVATGSIDGSATRKPFVIVEKEQRALTHDDKITRAECLWSMATAQLAISFNASQFLPEIFRSMFPDSQVATDYSLRSRKISYVISHGTGYYFTNELIKDVRKAYGFTLLFDETTIAGVRKQLDIFFRYWSETKNCICVRFYKSIILGHATADIVSRSIIDSLKADGIDITKILMLGRDNPNVNKAIEEILNKEVIAERKKKCSSAPAFGLVSIGSCPLHIIHGSFRKGIKSTSWSIDEALNDIWFWFSRSAARRQDFKLVAASINEIYSRFVNRFVDTRWVEIGPVIARVVDQWDIIREYFLVYLPTTDKKLESNTKYQSIKTVLNDNFTLVKFNFILFLYRTLFKKVLTWLQQEQPLIHLLYDECYTLLHNVLLSFVKEEVLKDKNGIQLLSISFDLQNNQKKNLNIDIGETTRLHISSLTVNEKTVFFQDVRQIYCTITKELIKTLPMNNDFLRHLRCLQSSSRNESSRTSIMYLARNLPHLLTNEEVDRVGVEWRVYEMADIPEEWIKRSSSSLNDIVEYVPIDEYWHHVFSTYTPNGTPQYVALTKLVKCLLSLSHGNSDVERGFSQNNNLVSDERSSLNEVTINGLRATCDGVKFFGGGKVHMVPITATLISNVKDAHSRYVKANEEQNKILNSVRCGDEKRACDAGHLDEEEIELLNKQKILQQDLVSAMKMLEEGSTRLATAVNSKDFNDVGTAELLVTAANAKLSVLKAQLLDNSENLNRLRKKKKK
ncbi:unnamed protein product [Adineta steineri]|uniref:Uncharacterized protein n=2 Tax=Adineta steineri TaxID=433720 RepID=A0A814MBT3_9BILA|nr:unnamed protein product [Adineta steineri]CAF3742747.1 unnamed protein product [Adineta steineri]CAF4051596.1 unnamed protein product [Adineta steineri]